MLKILSYARNLCPLISLMAMLIMYSYFNNKIIGIERQRDQYSIAVQTLSNQQELQNKSIVNLQSQEQEQQRQLIDAQIKAAQTLEQNQKDAGLIMDQNIPKQCEKAIKWAVTQAVSFKAMQKS